MAGQKLGASALLCYIHRDPSEPGGVFSLTVANVGTCQAVLCRDGRPVPFSKVYSLENCTEERERVKAAKAIITEVFIGAFFFFSKNPNQSICMVRLNMRITTAF